MSDAPQIYAALSKVMHDVGHVGKDRENPQQGYQFRGIDDVAKAVQPAFVAHGVVCVPRVLEREREMVPTKSGGFMASVRLLVEHTFYAADGSSVTAITLGEAMDSGDKASNKAMSAALKYALLETLCIPVDEPDRDTEEQSPERAKPKPAAATKAAASTAALPADSLEKEKALISASAQAARTKADIDALRPRFDRLPEADRTELRALLSARKAALPDAVPGATA